MSAFTEELRRLRDLHAEEVDDLRRAVTVLAVIPTYSDAEDPELQASRAEALRLARLYARRSLIESVPHEVVVQRLSKGLA